MSSNAKSYVVFASGRFWAELNVFLLSMAFDPKGKHNFFKIGPDQLRYVSFKEITHFQSASCWASQLAKYCALIDQVTGCSWVLNVFGLPIP